MLKQISDVGGMVEKRKSVCFIFVVLALLILQFMTAEHGLEPAYLIVFAILSFLLV
jgi:hypothetical protein